MFENGFKFFLGGIAAKWVEGLVVMLLAGVFIGVWYLYLVWSDKYNDWKRKKKSIK